MFGSSNPSSGFGQKPVFAGFGSATQTNPFGSTFQQSQPAFGSNVFGSSAPSGASSQPSFGATSTPAFGSSSTPSFGSTITQGFGATSTPMFGSTTFGSTGSAFGGSNTSIFGTGASFGASTTPVFGSSSSPAFGASSAPSFRATSSPSFAASSTPLFGSSSTPSFGTCTTSSFSFGSSPVFGQSSSAFGSSPFGSTAAPFGGQSSSFGSQASPTFGTSGFGQSTFGGQRGGSRIAPYTPTTDPESGSGTQPIGKMESISAMPAYKDKSHEVLRWEDYQLGDKASSGFGQKPVFAGFGSATQTNPFGSTFQQSQPAFGSNVFGSSAPFGASSQPSFGATSTPAFGSSSTPSFGSTITPGFGATSTPMFCSTTFGSTGSAFGGSNTSIVGTRAAFGASTTPVFGSSSSPAFGASSAPCFSTTSSPSFAASSTPLFGSSSTPSFGTCTTSSFSFGSSPVFGQSSSAFGSSPFGSTAAPFGGQSSSFGSQASPTFGTSGFGQSTFGGQRGGSRIAPYTPTTDPESGSGTQPIGKMESISAMPAYKDKSHEVLRWEDYQLGDKGYEKFSIWKLLNRIPLSPNVPEVRIETEVHVAPNTGMYDVQSDKVSVSEFQKMISRVADIAKGFTHDYVEKERLLKAEERVSKLERELVDLKQSHSVLREKYSKIDSELRSSIHPEDLSKMSERSYWEGINLCRNIAQMVTPDVPVSIFHPKNASATNRSEVLYLSKDDVESWEPLTETFGRCPKFIFI